jgi:hypothetical protein
LWEVPQSMQGMLLHQSRIESDQSCFESKRGVTHSSSTITLQTQRSAARDSSHDVEVSRHAHSKTDILAITGLFLGARAQAASADAAATFWPYVESCAVSNSSSECSPLTLLTPANSTCYCFHRSSSRWRGSADGHEKQERERKCCATARRRLHVCCLPELEAKVHTSQRPL